ncbi:hypothetical protein RSSM_03431 [Rhodopirellula sallentina SM41]|uniref:Uncharacterized protein n=2 Tax=Rhodopirellula TaxID=265488 RepID=M5U0Y0_9BACT|nr:hypothetical protein RSSM_03431 [Rhodopirellula sallentina SM41]
MELRLKLRLRLTTDDEIKQVLEELMTEFMSTSLPMDQFEKRIAMLEQAISEFIPRREKNYQSIEEVLSDYDEKIRQVDCSSHAKEQKDSLKAVLLMERDSMVQRLANQ